jgi:alkylhydroperoxidase/carboxymuconolactone decarboxylase family protein YurZ
MANLEEDTPVLDTVTGITSVSLTHSSLDPSMLMLLRLAALVAVDAPPASYLVNAAAAGEVGVTADQVQEVLIAVAPIVGTPRVTSAVGNIARALGFAIAVSESDLDMSEDANN